MRIESRLVLPLLLFLIHSARQAKITTELTEIISGAESIKEEATD